MNKEKAPPTADRVKKIRDNFRVYLECAHPAFLTTLVVLVYYDPQLSPFLGHEWVSDRNEET